MNRDIGNLVYIPSSTNLLKYAHDSPIKVFCLQSPVSLLVLEEKDNKLGVLFEGEMWYVEKKEVYDV
jgi:hypothetical protein